MNVLIMGHDLNEHQLIIDILEITFQKVTIHRATNFENLLIKLTDSAKEFNLIVIDLSSNEKQDDELIEYLHTNYSNLLHCMLLLAEKTEQAIEDKLKLLGITYLEKPFSLDTFGDIIKKIAKNISVH